MEDKINLNLSMEKISSKDMKSLIEKHLKDNSFGAKQLDNLMTSMRENMTPEKEDKIRTQLIEIRSAISSHIDEIIEGNKKALQQYENKKKTSSQGVGIVLEAEDMMKLFNNEEVLIEFGELKEIGAVKIRAQK